MVRLRFVYPFIALLLTVLPAQAQDTELAQERASLQGIDGFYLSVNLEGPRDLLDQEELNVRQLEDTFRARLLDAGLTVFEDRPARAEAADVLAAVRTPYLHVHVNLMDAGRGLVPFAVEAAFYQAVVLARDRTHPLAAVTWSTSLVGIVSYNNLSLIVNAATDLVDEFSADVQQTNP